MRRDLELKRFGGDLLINFSRVLGTTVFGIITSIIVARTLGPEGRGAYALATLLPQFLVTFTNLGIVQAIVYYVARERDRQRVTAIISTGIALAFWLSLAGVGIGGLAIWIGGHEVFPNVSLLLMAFALTLLPVGQLRQNLRGVFRGYEDFHADGAIEICYTLLNVVLLVVLVWLLDGQVWGAVLANIGASLLALVYGLWRLRTRVELARPWQLLIPDRSVARQLLSYGLRMYVAGLATNLLLRIDIFILNLLGSGVAAVGIYSVGVALAERLRVLLSAVVSVVLPRISSWDGDEDRRNLFTGLIVRHTLWLSIFPAIGIALLGGPFVRLLYGTEFEEAALAIVILLPGLILFNLGSIILADTSGRGKPGIGARLALLALIVNIIANIILIPRYDFLGAALASTIAYSFLGITWGIVFCRINRQTWDTLVLPTAEDVQRLGRLVRLVIARLRLLTGQ